MAAAAGTMAALLTAGLGAGRAAEAASVRVESGSSRAYGPHGGRAFDYGYERGRHEGAEQGHNDGRRRRDFDFWREGEYRDGDRGYKRWMGPEREYEAGFRRGYETGYRQAYASARPGWRGRAVRRGDYGYDHRYDREYDRYRDDSRDWR
jgi:hypothetical protein